MPSEQLRFEQRHAQIDEHDDRQDQQDQICGSHTRPKPQISPNMAATNPITPTTTQTSAMGSTLAPQPVTARWRLAAPRWRIGERPIEHVTQPVELLLHTKRTKHQRGSYRLSQRA